MRDIFALILTVAVYRFSSCSPSPEQCGRSYEKPILSSLRIVGGLTARPHSWPWIVSIRQTNILQPFTDPDVAFCGGTLINEKYVLTAAHCFFDVNQFLLPNYFVVIGAHYINETNPNRFQIKSVILHENYDDDFYLNDIALVELSHRINLKDSKVGIICLPSSQSERYPDEPLNGVAAGWGQLEENGSVSYSLQQLQLPIISSRNKFCFQQISDELIQFCAGFIQGGRDTCQGDSGGPLMIYDVDTRRWRIVGITSYGFGCARAENPGVYTRVSVYADWIYEHMSSSTRSSVPSVSVQIFSFSLFCIVLCFLNK